MEGHYEHLLIVAMSSEGFHYYEVMLATLTLLKDNNADKISRLMDLLPRSSQNGCRAYLRILRSCQDTSAPRPELVIACWLRCTELTEIDRKVVSNLTAILKCQALQGAVSSEKSIAAGKSLGAEYDKLKVEAQRLAKLQSSLQAADSLELTKIVARLKVKAVSPEEGPSKDISSGRNHVKPKAEPRSAVNIAPPTLPTQSPRAGPRNEPSASNYQPASSRAEPKSELPPSIKSAIRNLPPDVIAKTQNFGIGQIMWSAPSVMDLLLDSIYLACGAESIRLLRGCPVQSESELLDLLDHLPSSKDIGDGLVQHPNKDKEKAGQWLERLIFPRHQPSSYYATLTMDFLTWASRAHDCLLVPAQGRLHIPGFARFPQFLVAKASENKEEQFCRHLNNAGGTTRVVFHGTTLSRLHRILRTGLEACSGSALQRHGAVAGKGVYTSIYPELAGGFALPPIPIGGLPTLRQRKGPIYREYGVLLGCELAGSGTADLFQYDGVCVVRDPGALIVRYVILNAKDDRHMMINPDYWPETEDVVPDMERVFRGLREGTV